jgi:hypothetical protein
MHPSQYEDDSGARCQHCGGAQYSGTVESTKYCSHCGKLPFPEPVTKAPDEPKVGSMKKVYFVECRTGCSCCSGENHYRGPFSTEEIAHKRVVRYRELAILASQYSRSGIYHVNEHEAEIISKNRIIINESTVIEDIMKDSCEPGSDGERCCDLSYY